MERDNEIAAADLAALHPELHHYTGLDGLRGIVTNNTLWATHFSHLNDSSEVTTLKVPMIDELLSQTNILDSAAQYSNRRSRHGASLNSYVKKEVSIFVEAMFDTAFRKTEVTEPLAEAYIFSLCAHSPYQSYEAQNGLLSQWRAYGRAERFCIVFDTAKLIDLLDREFASHSWVYLRLAEVLYASKSLNIDTCFPDLLGSWANHIAALFRGTKENISPNMIIDFLSTATRFKHQGFQEEREIRVISIPYSQTMIKKLLAQSPNEQVRPVKSIRSRIWCAEEIPYIVLFESFKASLPIQRVIVGPSKHQDVNWHHASDIVGKRVPLIRSATPYNG